MGHTCLTYLNFEKIDIWEAEELHAPFIEGEVFKMSYGYSEDKALGLDRFPKVPLVVAKRPTLLKG